VTCFISFDFLYILALQKGFLHNELILGKYWIICKKIC
jgi:hypothetical protein